MCERHTDDCKLPPFSDPNKRKILINDERIILIIRPFEFMIGH